MALGAELGDAFGQCCGLGAAPCVERRVVMALPAAFRVPRGFAVADEEQARHRPAL